MVQIYEDQPSFGQIMGRGLGGNISSFLSEGLQQHLRNKKENAVSERFKQQFGFDIPEEGRREFYKSFGKKSGENFKSPDQENVNPAQNAFDTMSEMLSENIPGIGISPLTKIGVSRKGTEARGMFESMRSKIESVLLPKVNKGALSKPRFDFIMSQIPSPSDSQRNIAGKLRGLAVTLSEEGMPIDTSILDQIPWANEQLKNLSKKNKPSENLGQKDKIKFDINNEEHMQRRNEIIKKTKGNKAKAKQLLDMEFME